MFKKKPNIPPRPKPPANEFLVEDLQNAPSNDVVFKLAHNGVPRGEISLNPDSTAFSGNGNDIAANPEHVFLEVKNFVEVNRVLRDLMQEMEQKNEALHSSDRELKSIAEEIRKQALNALK